MIILTLMYYSMTEKLVGSYTECMSELYYGIHCRDGVTVLVVGNSDRRYTHQIGKLVSGKARKPSVIAYLWVVMLHYNNPFFTLYHK